MSLRISFSPTLCQLLQIHCRYVYLALSQPKARLQSRQRQYRKLHWEKIAELRLQFVDVFHNICYISGHLFCKLTTTTVEWSFSVLNKLLTKDKNPALKMSVCTLCYSTSRQKWQRLLYKCIRYGQGTAMQK